jgi:predicted AAA+ superfamily ATPase
VIENLITRFSEWRPSFFRSQNGAEIDLTLERRPERVAIEIKASTAPGLTRGFYSSVHYIKATPRYLVAPVPEAYPMGDGAVVTPMHRLHLCVVSG